MPTLDRKIKIELISRGLTIREVADLLTARGVPCRREELSMCIWGRRKYPRIRQALAHFLRIPERNLFADNNSKGAKGNEHLTKGAGQ